MRFLQNSPLLPQLRILYSKGEQPFWAIASQALTSGGNFFTTIIIVQSVGLTVFGRFSITFLTMMVVRSFLVGMLLTPMSVIGPKLHSTSDAAYRGFLLANAVSMSLIISIVLYVAFSLYGHLMGVEWLFDVAFGLGLANFTNNLADFFRRYEFSRSRAVRAFWIDFFRYATQLLLFLALSTIWLDWFTPQAALYAVAGGGLAACFAGAFYYGNFDCNRALNQIMWLRHWNFVKWVSPGVALESIHGMGPLFIGAALLGEATLGSVRMIQQLANILNLPINALQQIAPAIAARKFQQSGLQGLVYLLTRFLLGGLSLLVVSCAAILLGWEQICKLLFKSQESELLFIFVLYALLNFETLFKQLLFVFFHSIENPRVYLEAGFIAAVVSIVAIFPMTSIWGAYAIPASLIAGSTAVILFLGLRVNQSFSGKHPI